MSTRKQLSANEIALQLLPEHRLFAQAFVVTRGDRGKCIVAMNRPCPPKSIRQRCASLLRRDDVQRYIYALLVSEPDSIADFRSDPEWRGFIEELVHRGGSGEFAAMSPSVPQEVSPVGSVIPVDAAKGSPDVGFELTRDVFDLSQIQRFWRDTMLDSYQPVQARLKSSELLARSLGAFDPNTSKSIRTPITISMPSEADDPSELENRAESEPNP